ncbi:FAD-binding oxidoreductase [Rathayibacter festucae]|uniref:FAD-binding oxidoreductase n=1 Tax=Rathayibacter festucae DSM 15932 TaxID=1328866 RepID=A0A3Q9UR78_9MICO|nr:FAD-linked oxidase C-terminal domain-containing protein [Rathayibacter festucae]AZZ52210.1 FAD-binding oxidoreductase [Rathayibacter festucae DSM 15932]
MSALAPAVDPAVDNADAPALDPADAPVAITADVPTADRSGWSPGGTPLGVVRARTVDDVRAALRHASTHGIPVVTRGAASGLAGGASAGEGVLVLDVSGLDRILEIDPVDGVARVEPGVITADLDRAAAVHGLLYAPDPGSVEIATIGGTIATNAGGLRGAKYGVTRDAVLALDVVLADGSLVHLGRDTVKGVVGLDLTALVVGSEGGLGVVVGATLRLLPRPRATATAAALFADVAAGAEAAVALARAGLRPSVLELVDDRTLEAIDALRGSTLAGRGGAFLLVQTDGFGAAEEIAEVRAVLAATALSVETTLDPAEGLALASARRDALPAIEARGRVLIEDIAVPRSRLAEAIRRVHAIAADTGADVYVFAHAGDGNLHPIIRLRDDSEQSRRQADAAAEAVFALALELGGTVSGEHGVGALKREWARRELGPDVVALQRAVQRVFDPQGILNPGTAL